MSKHPSRPNFLVIMTDQQRGDALGIEGHPILLTPNMDSIAGQGIRFSRCYSTCPVCIPARRSFISGQFPQTHGMVGYREGVDWDPSATLAGELTKAGYHTCWVGRTMHLHPIRKRYGFDHMVISPDYHEWLSKNQPEGSGGYYGAGPMHNDWTGMPWHMAEALHQTNWTVNQALRFLKDYRDPTCPYFLVVSFIAPHPPLVPPAFYFNRYYNAPVPEPAIGEWAKPPVNHGQGSDISADNIDLCSEAYHTMLAGYYGLINHVDDQIRRLVNPINGVDQNAVVIVTSDHGEMLGDHYLFRKSMPYEGSARVPLLIRPSKDMNIRPGQVFDAPVCLEDIMPTVLDLACLEIPKSVEGKSLVPWMTGKNPAWRKYLHVEHSPRFHALANSKEKYIWFNDNGQEQLFDLTNDPKECKDLSNDPQWQGKLQDWRKRLIHELENRPEGFVHDKKLVPGRVYKPLVQEKVD